jgi:hypothetical protein
MVLLASASSTGALHVSFRPGMGVIRCTTSQHLQPGAPWVWTGRRSQCIEMSLEGVPSEVIEAEGKATPGRPARLAGTIALGGLSAASAALCVATLAGQPQAAALAENLLPFGNAPVSLAVNVVLCGTCGWVYQQELQTREQNILRIWDEVQRRKAAAGRPGKKGKQKRALAKTPAELRQQAKQQGAAPSSGASPAPPPAPPAPSPQAAEPGFLEKLSSSSFMEQANAMAQAHAMSLNDALEERGILPTLDRPSESAAPPREAEGKAAAADDAAAPRKPKSQKKRKKSKKR